MLGSHDLSENQLVPNGNAPLAHRRNGWFGEPRIVDGFRQHRRQLEPNALVKPQSIKIIVRGDYRYYLPNLTRFHEGIHQQSTNAAAWF